MLDDASGLVAWPFVALPLQGITLIGGPAGWRAVFPNEKRELSAGWRAALKIEGRDGGLQR